MCRTDASEERNLRSVADAHRRMVDRQPRSAAVSFDDRRSGFRPSRGVSDGIFSEIFWKVLRGPVCALRSARTPRFISQFVMSRDAREERIETIRGDADRNVAVSGNPCCTRVCGIPIVQVSRVGSGPFVRLVASLRTCQLHRNARRMRSHRRRRVRDSSTLHGVAKCGNACNHLRDVLRYVVHNAPIPRRKYQHDQGRAH